MKNLEVLTRDQVSPETREVFDELEENIGIVPNLYATAANSHRALTSMISATENLKKGEFSTKEVEAIALAVAEANGCKYCLSAHTVVAKMNGFTDEETIMLRMTTIQNKRYAAVTKLARAITLSRGRPDQYLVDQFFSAGFNKAALAELIGLVALNTFTNYTNNIADTEILVPLARTLPITD